MKVNMRLVNFVLLVPVALGTVWCLLRAGSWAESIGAVIGGLLWGGPLFLTARALAADADARLGIKALRGNVAVAGLFLFIFLIGATLSTSKGSWLGWALAIAVLAVFIAPYLLNIVVLRREAARSRSIGSSSTRTDRD
jgi:hypothetical protein